MSVEFPSRRRGNIFKAAAEGQIEAIQVLVAQGASVDARDKDGSTPLFLAARAGKCNVCRWLLEHGAELEARCTEQSLTALHAAVANDDVEVALLLIADYGANIFARTGTGEYMQTVIEQEHSTKLRTAFPAEFWIPNLSTIEQPRPQRPFKKYGESWNVLFHQTASDGLDVDLVRTHRTRNFVNCVNFSSDGKYLALVNDMGQSSEIYNVANGDKICSFIARFHPDPREYRITSLCFTPDGKNLVTGGENHAMKVWDIRTEIGHTLHTPESHDGDISSLDVARDGRIIVCGSTHGTIRIFDWDLDGFDPLRLKLTCNIGAAVSKVAISPDIKLVAAGSEYDKKTRVFDIRTGGLLYCLEDHQGAVLDVTFSLNMGELITSSADKTIKVWDLNSSHLTGQGAGVCKRTLHGHERSVLGVAVTPDSKWVLSGSADQGVQLWDVRTGYSQFVLRGHQSPVTCVAVSPVAGPDNGGLFATASVDEVHIWTYTTKVQ